MTPAEETRRVRMTDGMRMHAVGDLVAAREHLEGQYPGCRENAVYLAMRAIMWWRLGVLTSRVLGTWWPGRRVS